MDIKFKSASTDFKNILSLVPAIYKTEFDKVTASGNAGFEGTIKGVYSDSAMPGYHLAMTVKEGSFKYTDLPKAVQHINFNAVVDNADGQTDNTVVDITNGHLEIDKDPFDFRLLVKKPVSNMFVDAAAKGKLDLSQVANYVKLEKGTSIAGLMNADVNIKGNVKAIEKQQYTDFYAGGTIDVNKFNYTSPAYPTAVKINTVHTDFTPTKIDVSNLSGQYMNSNFSGGGQINNLLSYLLSGKPLRADLTINADKVNLNDWMVRMRQVSAIGIKAKRRTELQSGGYQVMLIDLRQPVKEGETVPLTLTFDDGSMSKVDAPVRKPQALLEAEQASAHDRR